MKKIITLLGFAVTPFLMNAQQFLVAHDTATLYTAGADDGDFITVYNTMDNTTNESYEYSWRFLNTGDLPAGWSFNGFCDIVTCRIPGFPSNWQTGDIVSGVTFPGKATSDLKLQLNVPTAGPAASVLLKLEVKSPLQTDTVYYFVSKNALSIKSIASDDDRFQLYPNPVSGSTLNIKSDSELAVDHIKIFNFFGQQVSENNLVENQNATIEIGALSPGLYFLQAFDKKSNNIVIRKFIKN